MTRRSFSIRFSHVFFQRHVRDSTKVNSTTSSSQKKSSTGQTLEQIPSTGSTQAKLMPILEGGETEESTSRIHFSTTTLDWTPAE